MSKKEKTTLELGEEAAKLLSQLGRDNPDNVWEIAWNKLEKAMEAADFDWRDNANLVRSAFKRIAATGWSLCEILDLIENGIKCDEKTNEKIYTEADMQEVHKIAFDKGRASVSNGNGSGNGGGYGPGYWVPDINTMMAHCQRRASQLRNSNDQNFVSEMYQGKTFSQGGLGYLMSIFIKTNGNYRKT